jgi:hypothetical protein
MNEYPSTFSEWVNFFTPRKGQHRHRAKMDNNTYAMWNEEDQEIRLRLHNTDIMVWRVVDKEAADKTIVDVEITLDTDGWTTVTTKDRMNKALPPGHSIYQENSQWYYYNRRDEKVYYYADGMVINEEGDVLSDAEVFDKEREKEARRTKRKIQTYAKNFIKALQEGKVPRPNNGDCWYCLMRGVKDGVPVGESFKDQDHIDSHIEEKYYVPSLLARAVEVFPVAPVATWTLAAAWNPVYEDGSEVEEPLRTRCLMNEMAGEMLAKSLRRYIYRQKGFAA